MLKWIKGLLIISSAFLLFISFPVRYVWEHPMMSDIFRLIGFTGILILNLIRTYEDHKKNR